jgi:hypothetical protein
MKKLAADGVSPTAIALVFLGNTTYNKTEQFKSVSKQSNYKKQINQVEETSWVRDLLKSDSLFNNIWFEVYV